MSERYPQHSSEFDDSDGFDDIGDYVDADDAAFDLQEDGDYRAESDGLAPDLWAQEPEKPAPGAPEPPAGYWSKSDGYEPNRRFPDAAQGITTGMKVGWVALGFFLGIIGPLVVFLFYSRRDPDLRSAALRYAVAGLAVGVVAEFLLVGWLTSSNPDLAGLLLGAPSADPGTQGWTSSNF